MLNKQKENEMDAYVDQLIREMYTKLNDKYPNITTIAINAEPSVGVDFRNIDMAFSNMIKRAIRWYGWIT